MALKLVFQSFGLLILHDLKRDIGDIGRGTRHSPLQRIVQPFKSVSLDEVLDPGFAEVYRD